MLILSSHQLVSNFHFCARAPTAVVVKWTADAWYEGFSMLRVRRKNKILSSCEGVSLESDARIWFSFYSCFVSFEIHLSAESSSGGVLANCG